MREVKFRVWYPKTRKMYTTLELAQNEENPCLFVASLGSFSAGDPYKLMQYTGLHDKHGKEVYEGDIVKAEILYFEDGTKREVQIVEIQENGLLVPFYLRVNYEEESWLEATVAGFEVIGNIYGNPEVGIGEE